jgi:uncharacterized protein
LAKRDAMLIVACSGRALAQSARRGGWRPLVADAFGDVDTRAYADAFVKIPIDDGADNQAIPTALEALTAADRHPTHRLASSSSAAFEIKCEEKHTSAVPAPVSLIYGAGIESRPNLLEGLGEQYGLVGNAPEVVKRVKDPITFSAALRALSIPHPPTRLAPPSDTTHGWLIKQTGGAGGGHIRAWEGTAPTRGHERYFQRYLTGPAMSSLFAADGQRAEVIGYNTQWTAGGRLQPFAYAGAINRASLTPQQRVTITGYVRDLTRAFRLRGLNSLDFILHRNVPWVLEINPRPTSTCELYEPEARDGMVATHVRACAGVLPASNVHERGVTRAHMVVYAGVPSRIPAGFRWPRWCRDLPQPGTRIGAGKPACSVHAEGVVVDNVRRLVQARRRSALRSLQALATAA